MILNKNNKQYKFDKLVKGFYTDIVKNFENEKTNHLFKPFGCDFAFIDAKINYRIMDELIKVWNDLGFNNDIEIKYSTPTKYVKALAEANKNQTDLEWSLRRDDTFPYAKNPSQYMSGDYTSRPQVKKYVRDLSQSFHSSLRLLTQ